jgi:cytochrome c5
VRSGGACEILRVRCGAVKSLRLFGAVCIALCCAGASANDRIELPPGPNRDLVYARCQTCHDLQYLKDSAGIPRDSWSALISDMVRYGLRLQDDERHKIVDYLATYLGPHPPPEAPAQAQVTMPVDGKALYARQCSSCHQASGEGVPGTSPYNGAMPSFDTLSDAQVAAIVAYVRSAWRNDDLRPAAMKEKGRIDASAVAEARGKTMSAADVHAYRAAHR